jgi:ribonuclease VapC
MVIDSSAVIAILVEENAAAELLKRIVDSERRLIGAPTVFETAMVLTSRRGLSAKYLMLDFLQRTKTQVVPFGEQHWGVALAAFQQFGKGRHPAGLNLGDCQSYAVAKLAGEPLLFVGSDFSLTDIEPAG